MDDANVSANTPSLCYSASICDPGAWWEYWASWEDQLGWCRGGAGEMLQPSPLSHLSSPPLRPSPLLTVWNRVYITHCSLRIRRTPLPTTLSVPRQQRHTTLEWSSIKDSQFTINSLACATLGKQLLLTRDGCMHKHVQVFAHTGLSSYYWIKAGECYMPSAKTGWHNISSFQPAL